MVKVFSEKKISTFLCRNLVQNLYFRAKTFNFFHWFAEPSPPKTVIPKDLSQYPDFPNLEGLPEDEIQKVVSTYWLQHKRVKNKLRDKEKAKRKKEMFKRIANDEYCEQDANF